MLDAGFLEVGEELEVGLFGAVFDVYEEECFA